MRKRDHFIQAGVVACATGAVMLLIASTEESRQRGVLNIERICAKVWADEPCPLKEPPKGALDGKS